MHINRHLKVKKRLPPAAVLWNVLPLWIFTSCHSSFLFQNMLRTWILGFWRQERVWLTPDLFHPTYSCGGLEGSRRDRDLHTRCKTENTGSSEDQAHQHANWHINSTLSRLRLLCCWEYLTAAIIWLVFNTAAAALTQDTGTGLSHARNSPTLLAFDGQGKVC